MYRQNSTFVFSRIFYFFVLRFPIVGYSVYTFPPPQNISIRLNGHVYGTVSELRSKKRELYPLLAITARYRFNIRYNFIPVLDMPENTRSYNTRVERHTTVGALGRN